jgi:TldD protein
MMKRHFGWLVVLCGCLMPQPVPAQQQESAVVQALREELARSMDVLGKQADPAFFIAYQVNEMDTVNLEATLGTMRSSDAARSRYLDIDIRVGSYEFDNTHEIRGPRGGASSPSFISPVAMPIENDVEALKSVIWLETDRRYKTALERWIQVKANRALKVEEQDISADFSREPVQQAALPLVRSELKPVDWEAKLKDYSALFRKYPEILEGSVGLASSATNKYLVNSEGTSVQQGSLDVRLSIYAATKAEDGMELYRYESFNARSISGLPGEKVVRDTIEKMIRDLKELRAAPVIDAYTGPAILSGRASGVFFHEIFGHRIEGQRQKSENEGQTFARQIGKSVLPDFLSVIDDPTSKQASGIDLNGYYAFDDEGVPAQAVAIVENGILKNFLMSRMPITGFSRSNGHGRKAPGYRAVGRQGNLIVRASKTVSNSRLREMLIAEAKAQGKPFGLLFSDISGGYTMTGRSSPQAFQVTPIIVYRIYVDGRADELVRGVDLIGTPLTSFSKIVAAGDTPEVFNGFCGAESGTVLVSAVSPAILTTQIEVQKKAKSSERMPILPPPSTILEGGLQ